MGKDKIHELVDIIDTENIEFIYNFLSNFIENIQNKNSDITKKEIGLNLCTNK